LPIWILYIRVVQVNRRHMRQQCQYLTGRPRGGGSAKQGVHSTSTEQGQSATRVFCVVVEVVAANVSNWCVQASTTRRHSILVQGRRVAKWNFALNEGRVWGCMSKAKHGVQVVCWVSRWTTINSGSLTTRTGVRHHWGKYCSCRHVDARELPYNCAGAVNGCQHQHGIHTPNPACASGLSESLRPSTSPKNKNLRMGICMEVLCRYQTDGESFLEQTVTRWNMVPPFRPSNEADEPGMETSGITEIQKGTVICYGWQGHVDNVRRYPWTTAVGVDAGRCNDQRPTLLWHLTESPTGHQTQTARKLSQGLLMLHDNARPYAVHATPNTLHRFGWGVLDHPPYRSDLSPCDYHVFGPLKKTLKGRRFNSDEAVREVVE
jgi:hypothetical protein